MDISYTLIVALMFITILSFGFANILSSLAEIVNKKNQITVCSVHLQWILILFMLHMNLAWQAVLIATNQSWSYDTFLFVELGPILAFFMTRILAPSEVKDKEPGTLQTNYIGMSQQFFFFFALIQAWGIGTDFVLKRGVTGSGIFNMLLIALALVMINRKNYRDHVYGVVIAWALFLVAIGLRGFHLID